MAEKKPRIQQSTKDMVWSLIPLVLACLAIAAIAGQCSLSAGGPRQGQVPRIDLSATLRADADILAFPIRQPAVPDSWIPNSATRKGVTGNAQISTVGFVTDTGSYVSLNQTDAAEPDVVRFIAGDLRTATGAEQVGTRNWVVYGGDGVEPIWVADLGTVRLAITGSGSTEQFTTLAAAAASAPGL